MSYPQDIPAFQRKNGPFLIDIFIDARFATDEKTSFKYYEAPQICYI